MIPSRVGVVTINGRFLTQQTTGVQRFAIETVRALDELLASGGHRDLAVRVRIVRPRSIGAAVQYKHIEEERIGRLRGHAWEQTELAFHARDDLLVSLCNAGPLAHSLQIIAIHDAAVRAVPQGYGWKYRTWYGAVSPILARRAAKVLTVSEFSRVELSRWFGIDPGKTTVLPESGEHLLRCAPDHRVLERHGLQGRKYVLAVSSLNPNKNFARVIHAYGLFRQRFPEVGLVITGSIDRRVFADARVSLSPPVVHVGYASDAELRALYEGAVLLLYPSLYEGFGLPPVEAMNCGCPVVVSRDASLPEVCRQAAYYCDARDALDIAAKVQQLLGEPDAREALRRQGLARSAELSWAHTANRLWQTIKEVLVQ